MASQKYPLLISGTCEYVIFSGKRNFPDVIKDMDIEMGDYPGLSKWDQFKSHQSLKIEEGSRRVGQKGVTQKTPSTDADLQMEDGGQPLEVKKGKEKDPP